MVEAITGWDREWREYNKKSTQEILTHDSMINKNKYNLGIMSQELLRES